MSKTLSRLGGLGVRLGISLFISGIASSVIFVLALYLQKEPIGLDGLMYAVAADFITFIVVFVLAFITIGPLSVNRSGVRRGR